MDLSSNGGIESSISDDANLVDDAGDGTGTLGEDGGCGYVSQVSRAETVDVGECGDGDRSEQGTPVARSPTPDDIPKYVPRGNARTPYLTGKIRALQVCLCFHHPLQPSHQVGHSYRLDDHHCTIWTLQLIKTFLLGHALLTKERPACACCMQAVHTCA